MKKSLLVVAVFAVIMGMIGNASAASLNTFTLNNPNPDLLAIGSPDYATVDIAIDGLNITVTGTGLNGYGFIDGGFLGINFVGLPAITLDDGHGFASVVSPCTEDGCTEDIFGNFNFLVSDKESANPRPSFTFSGVADGTLGLESNDQGYAVAAHMCKIENEKCEGGFTGYATTRGNPPGTVPEPSTLLLLGTGLLGMCYVAHRKQKNSALSL